MIPHMLRPSLVLWANGARSYAQLATRENAGFRRGKLGKVGWVKGESGSRWRLVSGRVASSISWTERPPRIHCGDCATPPQRIESWGNESRVLPQIMSRNQFPAHATVIG